MRVGIIGTGWGRTHCGTFRAAGWEIAALAGRRLDDVTAVAAAEGVPRATADPDELEDCDVIVVARALDGSPSPTAALLRGEPALASLEALRRDRIVVLPAALFSTVSQRLVDAAETLSDALDAFAPPDAPPR